MGKRSDFARVPRDFYPTPAEAVAPLLRHLMPRSQFIEPCAGNGVLVDYLTREGHQCIGAWDISPARADIQCRDALRPLPFEVLQDLGRFSFITNPPWDRKILHPLIVSLSEQAPTWLLFDADWSHTRQAAPFMPRLRRIVSVGRVKWIPDSPFTGKDNCAWHLFDKPTSAVATFYGREVA